MKMIGRILVILMAIVATGIPAGAQNPSPIVGTWRLVSFDREIVGTKEVVHAFGGHATGFVTYTADGRVMTMIVDSTRKPPAQNMATDAEAVGLYRTMLAYVGTYRIVGDTLSYHLEITWNQIESNTDQVRHFKVDGDRLTYTTEPLQNAFLNNQMVTTSLVWERVK
jgi:hypothetical protein